MLTVELYEKPLNQNYDSNNCILREILLDWTRGACRPLEERFLTGEASKICEEQLRPNTALGPIIACGYFCSKIEKVMKKVGPRNQLHSRLKVKVAGPSFGCLKNKRLIEACVPGPYAIRLISAKIRADKQTNASFLESGLLD